MAAFVLVLPDAKAGTNAVVFFPPRPFVIDHTPVKYVEVGELWSGKLPDRWRC